MHRSRTLSPVQPLEQVELRLVCVCLLRAQLRCSEGTKLSVTHQHLFLQQETDCRGWRRCTEMFGCYIPDERAGLCYAARVLSAPAKIPGCVVKVKPKILSRASRGVRLPVFSVSTCASEHKCSCLLYVHVHVCVSTKSVYVFRISCKDLKSMLSQVNYRVPNMRFLREKLPVTTT